MYRFHQYLCRGGREGRPIGPKFCWPAIAERRRWDDTTTTLDWLPSALPSPSDNKDIHYTRRLLLSRPNISFCRPRCVLLSSVLVADSTTLPTHSPRCTMNICIVNMLYHAKPTCVYIVNCIVLAELFRINPVFLDFHYIIQLDR